ncbi:MAG: methionine ABC transporter substrate-binding protein [Cellulomonas sp.]|jgi:D-methionine transport system substrate-binding protein|nr:methionine ABC transporter substrate-binding protein [Cellulomonas sp.]
MSRTRAGLVGLAVVAALALTASCSSDDGGSSSPTFTPGSTFSVPGPDDKGGKNNPVKVGVVGSSDAQWPPFVEAAKAEGIYVELVNLTDYETGNPTLSAGDLDLNQFQHVLFLAKYNIDSGKDLVPVGSTAIYPLALYSGKYDSVAAIPDGAQVVVPNDGTNQTRALQLLDSAGLIKLKDGTPLLSTTPDDIDTGASRVKVTPVAADQTTRSLEDPAVAGAVVNNDFVAPAGLDPADALVQDDPTVDGAKPYINIWVARSADQYNPVFLKLIEIAQTDPVEAGLLKQSENTAVLVHSTPAELRTVLDDVTAQLKNS